MVVAGGCVPAILVLDRHFRRFLRERCPLGALAWDRLINRYFGSDCGPDVLFWLLAAVSLVLMWLDKKPGDRKAIILVLLVVSLLAVCPDFISASTTSFSPFRRWRC